MRPPCVYIGVPAKKVLQFFVEHLQNQHCGRYLLKFFSVEISARFEAPNFLIRIEQVLIEQGLIDSGKFYT